jgi:glycosyltransferase involved in cell wall biosynthesis
MKIGMVLDHYFPPDDRVEKEAQALIGSDNEVFLLCLRRNFREKSEINYKGVTLYRIYIPYGIIKKLRALTNTIFNFYPYLWAFFINKMVKRHQIDVLHIHDLYMFSSAFTYKKISDNKIPLIGDLHENFAEGLKHYKFSNSFPGNILISIKKWEKSEIEWSHKMDHILTVIEEAAKRYQSLGIPPEKIHVVANYVDIDEYLSQHVIAEITEKFKNYFNLTYTGAFDLHRGLEGVVNSLPGLLEEGSDIRLVLAGGGSNEKNMMEQAKNLGVFDKIFFEGWQKRKNFYSYIKASDICLVPHLKTVHTDNTIPHKLFHYMLLKKPVIVSDCTPLSRIVRDADCGLIFQSNNVEDFIIQVKKLYNDPEMRERFGENGYKAVHNKYNWDFTKLELVNLYKKIAVSS